MRYPELSQFGFNYTVIHDTLGLIEYVRSMLLRDISTNVHAVVHEVSGPSELVVRLKELGFTSGVSVRIVGRSVFKSPIYVEVRGAVLALREGEAECISVQLQS